MCIAGSFRTAPGRTWQKNGDITFDEAGWIAFVELLHARVEFVPEDVDPSSAP